MFSSKAFSSMMFSSLMVVVMLQMLLQTSEAEVDVSASPERIVLGLSPSLDVNCTFSMSSNGMAEIISLVVSRGNNSQLASITTFSDHHANVISSEGFTADGVINPGGQSYIHLHWDYPTDTLEGTYQCIARGMDLLGNTIETVNTSVVSADQPDVQDLIDELKKTQKTVAQMQTSYFQEIQQLQTSFQQMQLYITQLEYNVSYLDCQMENEIDLCTNFVLPPLSYNNTQYFVSKAPYQDFNESIAVCNSYGGILAEMDDLDEYHAVQNYMENVTGVDYLFIGGTDEGHDGTWVLPSSQQELPVTDWLLAAPGIGNAWNCLCLIGPFGWGMDSRACHYNSIVMNMNIRFMCEL